MTMAARLTPAMLAPKTASALAVRLARSPDEVMAAQRLRYRVFYDDMGATPSPAMAKTKRDFDDFDDICDHLLVLDEARGQGAEAVVGTYRLIRRDMAEKFGRFYSESEYDIKKIIAQPGNLLELGRSCIEAPYRIRPVMEMLWRGIADYVLNQHNIDLMFGCVSFPGTDINKIALPLSYLYHYHLAPSAIRPRALPDVYNSMALLPKTAVEPRAAVRALPPLIKGYLRLGGVFGDGAFIDRQWNSIDVCVIVETKNITNKYFRHYARAIDFPGLDDGTD